MKVLFFTAPWCAACKEIKPFVEREAANRGASIEYVDVDANPDAANNYGIRNIPMLIIERDGDTVDMISGAQVRMRLPKALAGA